MSFTNMNVKQAAAADAVAWMTKEAFGGAAAKPIGQGVSWLLKSILPRAAAHTMRGAGKAVQGVGRILGASGRNLGGARGWEFAGKNLIHKGWGNSVARWGQKWIDKAENLNRYAGKYARDLQKHYGKNWTTARRWIKNGGSAYFKYGWMPGMAAEFGADWVPDWMRVAGKPAEWAFDYLTPAGLAFNGVAAAGQFGYNAANKYVTNIAANAAYDASQQTALEIANELGNRDSMEYLYGAFDPQGYARAMYQNAVPRINQTFSDQMAQRGFENWKPQNYIQ